MYSLLKILNASALCTVVAQGVLGSEQPLDASELEAERVDVARLLQRPLSTEGPDALPPAPVELEGPVEDEEVPTGAETLEAQVQPDEEEEELKQQEAGESTPEEGEAEEEAASVQREKDDIANEAGEETLQETTQEPGETEMPSDEQ